MARLQLAALAAVCLAVSASAALPTLPESGTLDNFIGILMSSDIQVPPSPAHKYIQSQAVETATWKRCTPSLKLQATQQPVRLHRRNMACLAVVHATPSAWVLASPITTGLVIRLPWVILPSIRGHRPVSQYLRLQSCAIQAPITQPLGVGVRTYTTQLDLQDPSFTPTNVNDTNVPTQVRLLIGFSVDSLVSLG